MAALDIHVHRACATYLSPMDGIDARVGSRPQYKHRAPFPTAFEAIHVRRNYLGLAHILIPGETP